MVHPNGTLIERMRKCADGCQWPVGDDLSIQERLLREGADEIERLWAALKYIADNPVSDEVADYAREALMSSKHISV